MVYPTIVEDEAGINPGNKADSDTINPGETVEIRLNTDLLEGPRDLLLGGTALTEGSDLNSRVSGKVEQKLADLTPGEGMKVYHFTPEQSGTLKAFTDTTWATTPQVTVEPGEGSGGIQNDTAYAPEEEEERVNTPEGSGGPSLPKGKMLAALGVIGAIAWGAL